jgi:hypothetical protein
MPFVNGTAQGATQAQNFLAKISVAYLRLLLQIWNLSEGELLHKVNTTALLAE